MTVTERNFFRLLLSGTFGSKEPLEPMSPWKWKRLHQLSLMHGVAALVYDGLARKEEFFLQLPQEQWQMWANTTQEIEANNQQMNIKLSELVSILNANQTRPILIKGQGLATVFDHPLHRTPGDTDIFFPYTPQANKANQWAQTNGTACNYPDKGILEYTWQGISVEHHQTLQRLTNALLNRKLQRIIDKEIRACDSEYVTINDVKVEIVPPTLHLLIILLRITRFLLNEGISLKQLVDLGMFLRKWGDRVDFVKLNEWIDSLKLAGMVQIQGALLVHIFGFNPDELPFLRESKSDNQSDSRSNTADDASINMVMDEVFLLNGIHSNEWYFSQGKNIFVSTSNSSAMLWHVRHSAKYFRYYPAETITNLFSSFAHSLSHIEE